MSVLGNRPLADQLVGILGVGSMGLACAVEVLGLGGSVLLMGRRLEKLEAANEKLEERGQIAIVDARDPQDLERALSFHMELNHLVVAISAGTAASGIAETSVGAAQNAFGRLWASYNAVHLAPKHLSTTGSVTLVSGSSARTPVAGYGVWSALHGSIESLVRAAAVDIAPIRVNAVSPGGIGMEPDRQLAHHYGEASDIGIAVASIIVNPAMTGTVIDVDSGERKGSWSG